MPQVTESSVARVVLTAAVLVVFLMHRYLLSLWDSRGLTYRTMRRSVSVGRALVLNRGFFFYLNSTKRS